VPTRTVRADCERLLSFDAARIDVIAEAAAPAFRRLDDPAPLLARLGLPSEFILWVGGLDPPDPRKGIRPLATAAARRDGPPLVLAGRTSDEAADLAVPKRVILTGRVSDDELAALYSAATALVFPSEEEGFGLPPLEALACGTPVAAFDIDAMRELHGDSADVTLVDQGNIDGLLDAAEAFAGRQATAPSRTWADVAGETWSVYAAARSR